MFMHFTNDELHVSTDNLPRADLRGRARVRVKGTYF